MNSTKWKWSRLCRVLWVRIKSMKFKQNGRLYKDLNRGVMWKIGWELGGDEGLMGSSVKKMLQCSRQEVMVVWTKV